jgi:predicted GH43/DUF377 family glycosyl hydrolase
MIKWQKRGLIFEPNDQAEWLKSHAWMPTPVDLGDGFFKIYFAGRNSQNLSQIGAFTIHIDKPGIIHDFTADPIIKLGALGTFDDSAVMPSQIFQDRDEQRLFYVGWMQGKRVPFYAMIGEARSIDGGNTFQKTFRVPYLPRNEIDPLFMAASFILKTKDNYKMWYTTNTAWREINGETLPKYHIKYAESEDGTNWARAGQIAIDFKSDEEYAISRPWVIEKNGLYKMWYSYRGDSYRIGYAESDDGVKWIRQDDKAGITVSDQGFDSEMIEYAAVIKHKDQHLMFYNGNNFGFGGIGLAMEE